MLGRPPANPVDDSPIRWADCEDLVVRDDEGVVLYSGPKYLRCKRAECSELVTHGMAHAGGCWCGNRRLGVALKLTTTEKALLKRGYYPLCAWEQALIRPSLPDGKALGWGTAEYQKRMHSA